MYVQGAVTGVEAPLWTETGAVSPCSACSCLAPSPALAEVAWTPQGGPFLVRLRATAGAAREAVGSKGVVLDAD
jgi:hypothetical protein